MRRPDGGDCGDLQSGEVSDLRPDHDARHEEERQQVNLSDKPGKHIASPFPPPCVCGVDVCGHVCIALASELHCTCNVNL